jgi:hypothetical protein
VIVRLDAAGEIGSLALRKAVATMACVLVSVTLNDSLISATNDRFCAVASCPRGIALMRRHLFYKIADLSARSPRRRAGLGGARSVTLRAPRHDFTFAGAEVSWIEARKLRQLHRSVAADAKS